MVATGSDHAAGLQNWPKDWGVAGCSEGEIILDMTTSEPSLAAEIAETAAARGVAAVDAPVSGGDVGARGAAPCRS